MRVVVLLVAMGCMVPPPKTIPSNGVVECTDTREAPAQRLLVSAVAAAIVAAGARDPEWSINHGGMLWMPVLGSFAGMAFVAAGEGLVLVGECKAAKRRGAELQSLARLREAQANSRRLAVEQWKFAVTEARLDQCSRVRERGARIMELDVEFHAIVYMRDVAIARCERGYSINLSR